MERLEWTLSLKNPFVRCATFFGVFASLVLTAGWRPFSAYILLLWSVFLFFSIHPDQLFPLWVLYSSVYWAHGHGKEDSNALLALTTVLHAAGIAADVMAREFIGNNPWVVMAFSSIVMLPMQCNNMYYTPVFSAFRIGVFLAIEVAEPRGSWLIREYPLFSKQEALPFLVLAHIAAKFVRRRRGQAMAPPQMLPVTMPNGIASRSGGPRGPRGPRGPERMAMDDIERLKSKS